MEPLLYKKASTARTDLVSSSRNSFFGSISASVLISFLTLKSSSFCHETERKILLSDTHIRFRAGVYSIELIISVTSSNDKSTSSANQFFKYSWSATDNEEKCLNRRVKRISGVTIFSRTIV